MGVSAIKEAIEDYARHVEDKKNNMERFEVIRGNSLVEVPSQDIKTGDVVYIKKGQRFPADLIMLSSSAEGGISYVQTANLDG